MEDDDRALELRLTATRRRRATAAKIMVAALIVPLGVQFALVSVGVAARWGLLAVAVPAAVVWIIVRGRRARPRLARDHRDLLN